MWQYFEIDFTKLAPQQDEIDLLNLAGNEGWELITIAAPHRAILRRPLEKAARTSEHQAEERIDHRLGPAPVKYRDPATGQTWSGRGRMASWLAAKVEAGEPVENYLVAG